MKINAKELQFRLLQMMKCFHSICEDNDLKYYIIGINEIFSMKCLNTKFFFNYYFNFNKTIIVINFYLKNIFINFVILKNCY